ncbi:MAG: OmpH family outer membrane protein [Pseudomonadota bacterium]
MPRRALTFRSALATIAVAAGLSGPLAAQTAGGSQAEAPRSGAAQAGGQQILIIDRERVLRESEAALRLAAWERAERLALGAELDALSNELEAEEAEIAALREGSEKDVFEARAEAFHERARLARRESQRKIQALQKRFVSAREDLAAALGPLLLELLVESGAALIVDARHVLVARPGADVTAEMIRRLNAAAGSLPPLPEAQSDDGG